LTHALAELDAIRVTFDFDRCKRTLDEDAEDWLKTYESARNRTPNVSRVNEWEPVQT
jgi:hypothetical protein